ncbi:MULTISPECIES: FtsH protease activity modulator HflK [Basfia]|uniref:Protein HflK n=2 Tax=Basfia TaxID=697331 RepID=Q65S34_MANSM|nr:MULTISPECIES: FtsH protease activity modulator HflK [Basfia]AAU38226.1 HflC protein [[Mannheimia] succiniciproducens MBEL55E]QIM68888.1 HflK protein [Basfia succiniciproducens]SCY02519.1 protease FtsH subunit HflC [Basfia succiniciproducens]
MSLNDQDPWAKPGQNDPKQPENPSNKPDNKSGWSDRQDNKEQSPPDIEEIFGNLLKKLGGNGGQSNNGNNTNLPKNLNKLAPAAIALAVVLWGLSGLYTVKEAERGVVTRFGQLHSIVQPGLNWKPNFIDEVIPVNVEQVKELRTQGAMLTQDENMVKVEMTVQYRVQDPAKYLFSVTNADDSLNQATDSALRYVIGHMTMDDILTTGRAVVREQTWKTLNNVIKPYDMGVEVIDVNFQSARPPEEVKDAFDDAIKAQEDEQRYIREAEAYAREQEPIARGDAQRIVEGATAYKDKVVLNAKGEVERLQRLLPEFKASPDLLRERLYIQSMEQIMSKTPKIMLDGNGNNLNVLPVDQILRNKNTQPAAEPSANQGTLSSNELKSAVKNGQNSHGQTQTDDRSISRQGRFN